MKIPSGHRVQRTSAGQLMEISDLLYRGTFRSPPACKPTLDTDVFRFFCGDKEWGGGMVVWSGCILCNSENAWTELREVGWWSLGSASIVEIS